MNAQRPNPLRPDRVRPNWFFALWPDDATRTKLQALQTRLHGRMTRANNMHLTLAFLGAQPDAMLPLLRSILSQLTVEPMTITIDRLGYFKRNRVAWAGTHTMPETLMRLQKTLSQELVRKGFTPDTYRDYQAHITLARDATPPDAFDFEPFVWQADRVVLARSPLPEERPWYQVLGENFAVA